MMRKILSLTVLIALAALAGAGCKKDSGQGGEDKSYLTDQSKPLGGTVTKPGGVENKDPCLTKGAVGAQALMLKGDCAKVTPAVCGNTKTEPEAGEQCDNGAAKNGKDGKCTADCKNVGVVIPPGAVKITTQGNDAQFGKCPPGGTCTITLKADGMKGSSYDWTLVDAPSFKAQGGNTASSYILKGENVPNCDAKDPKYNAGQCTISVKVCPKGDSDAGHCDAGKFVLASDHLVISAYHMAGAAPYCTSSGNACAPFKFGELLFDGKPFNYLSKEGGEVYFTEPKENDLLTSALVAVRLRVEGSSVKDDGSYKWKMTVDGKDVPVVTHEEMMTNKHTVKDDKGNTYSTFDPKLPSADVFLLNVTPDFHYILFSPAMYGKTVNNIVITVTNAGGQQSMVIPSISVPGKDQFPGYQAQVDTVTAEKKAEADKNDPCNKLALTIDTVNDKGPADAAKPVDVTLDAKVKVGFSVSGGLQPVVAVKSVVMASPPASYDWVEVSNAQGKAIYERQFRYGNRPLSSASVNDMFVLADTMTATATDPKCPGKSATATLKFNVRYPELSTASVGGKVKVDMSIGASDTNVDNLFLAIVDAAGHYFYAYFNDNNGINLNTVGDGAPWDCWLGTKYGVSQHCPVSSTMAVYTADGGATDSLKQSYLKAHVYTVTADWTGRLDVWIHTIKVTGKYWEAEYGDNENDFTKEKANITKGDKQDYPWTATGLMPWKRRAVPGYDE